MGNSLNIRKSLQSIRNHSTEDALFVCKDGAISANLARVNKYCYYAEIKIFEHLIMINARDFPCDIVAILVTYISGDKKEKLELSTLESLLEFCIFIGCQSLIKKIESYGEKIESPISANYFYEATHRFPMMSRTTQYCFDIVLEALPLLSNSEEFNKLDGELLLKLFSEDIYKGENKTFFILGILLWLHSDPEQRLQYEERLFSGINVLDLTDDEVFYLLSYEKSTRLDRVQQNLKSLDVINIVA